MDAKQKDATVMKLTAVKRDERLRRVRERVVGLTTSPLYEYRVGNGFVPVVGEGNHMAKIMFVAEAPGYYEAKSGYHFRGAAGKVFDELMASIKLSRREVYITNIIKDKLPSNRDPSEKEIEAYAPFLLEQIKVIEPEVIVTLGRFSTNYLMELCGREEKPLKEIHGRPVEVTCSYGKCAIVPMFHPAAGLYNAALLPMIRKDFRVVRKLVGGWK